MAPVLGDEGPGPGDGRGAKNGVAVEHVAERGVGFDGPQDFWLQNRGTFE